MDFADTEAVPLLAPSQEAIQSVKIWPLIHHIKRDVEETIDTSISWDQLNASDVTFTIVRPLVFKYASLRNLATVFAFMVVRAHFLSSAAGDLAHGATKISRASLCELVAIRMLRHFARNPIELVAVLTINWNPLAGAPPEVIDAVRKAVGGHEEDLDDPASTLEIAISTSSKHLLASPLCQTVVNDIYNGHVVYSVASSRSLIADNYKQRPIEFYDPARAPLLDHWRLRVPKYGSILEFLNFTVLLLTFLLCLSNKDFARMNIYEIVFIIFALSFALGEYAACQEHGWEIYTANMWNGFDTAFICIFFTYFGLRFKGIYSQDDWYSDLAFDILACGACILFPRLAFFAISNNVVILALRGMIAEFLFFIFIAAICFSGLLFTLWDLAGGKWTVKDTAWLMVQIWFGNTSLSFGQASSFHPLFGPPLMIIYAALSNTLLITILISILSNTFARIDQHATEEYLFQFAISTIEGVKSDALFSYQPPFNILAFLLLAPLSIFASPRTLHSVNVFLIRITSFPILIVISLYERYLAPGRVFVERSKDRAAAVFNSLPRGVQKVALIDALVGGNGSDLFDAIFDVDIAEDNVEQLFPQGENYFDRAQIMTQHEDEEPPETNAAEQTIKPVDTKSADTTTPAGTSKKDQLEVPSTTTSPQPNPRSRSEADANRLRKPRAQNPSNERPLLTFDEEQQTDFSSPLTRLFSRRPPRPSDLPRANRGPSGVQFEEAIVGIRNVEGMLEAMKEDREKLTAAQKLRGEMKELQERQARIETLLMTLTRGMRGDSVMKSPI